MEVKYKDYYVDQTGYTVKIIKREYKNYVRIKAIIMKQHPFPETFWEKIAELRYFKDWILWDSRSCVEHSIDGFIWNHCASIDEYKYYKQRALEEWEKI
jgi:hypothetical protein